MHHVQLANDHQRSGKKRGRGQRALLVYQAVGEGLEEGIGGVVLHQYPLPHGQGLSCGRCYHITLAWVDEHLNRQQVIRQNLFALHDDDDDDDKEDMLQRLKPLQR